MYKVASDKAQSGARRLKLTDLQNGDLVLTDEERRDSIKARMLRIDEKLKDPRMPKAARVILGKEKFELQNMLRSIRPAKKCPGVQQHFMDVVRASVTKAQWNAWMAEAVQRKERGDETVDLESDAEMVPEGDARPAQQTASA
jgi:hypothetical protein